MLKQRVKKALSILVAACSLATAVTPVMAITNVDFVKNSDGTATVTAESPERIAVAQYDKMGMLKSLGISSLVGSKNTVTFNYDDKLDSFIYSYEDFETLKPETAPVKIGNRTIMIHNFDSADTSYVLYSLNASTMDKNYETTDKLGKSTTAVKLQRKELINTEVNAQFFDMSSASSDYVVLQADMRIDASNITNIYTCIRAVVPGSNPEKKCFQRLWTVEPKGSGISKIWFGNSNTAEYTVEEGQWITYSFAIDFREHKMKCYIDGVFKQEVSIDERITYDNYRADTFQFFCGANRMMDVTLDNICSYEGTKPRDVLDSLYFNFDTEKTTIVTKNETTQRQALKNCYAVHMRSGVALGHDGKKVLLENKPYIKYGRNYVHFEEINKVWNLPDSLSVPLQSDGYVDLESIESELGLKLYMPKADISDGLVVIGSSFTAPKDLQALNDFMLYLRPSYEDVLNAYRNSDVYGVHPRIFATQADFDRLKQQYEAGTDENIKYWGDAVISYANSRMNNAPPVQEESAEGRVLCQRELASDVHAWAMAYHLTGDEKYVREAVKDMTVYCEVFPNWHPQAHLDIVESMAAFAIAYDWMYHAFTKEERALFEKTMYEEGYYYCYQAFLSLSTPMGNAFNNDANHGTVCNGSVTQAALAFMDVFPQESAWLISNAIRGNEYNMYHWNTGAWFEGPHYWEYAIINTVKFLGGMDSVLGTDFGFSSIEGLSENGFAEISMHGNVCIMNYGDAHTSNFYSPEFMWLADKYNQPALGNVLIKRRTSNFNQVNRLKGEPMALALIWYKPEYVTTELTLDRDYYNEELDIATSRSSWESDSTFIGLKGGPLRQAHSQLDAGSFVFESDGIRWFQDLGADSYEKGYWDSAIGGKRWLYFKCRAEAHNTVVTNPTPANEDMDIGSDSSSNTAKLSMIEQKDNGLIMTIDMSTVLYDVSNATRGFFLTDNRRSLVVRDEIKIPGNDNTVYWYLMPDSSARVTVDDENDTITLTRGSKSCKVEYKIEGGTGSVETFEKPIVSTIGDNLLSSIPNRGRIVLKITGVSESCTITAKITPSSVESPTSLSDYTKPISSWSLS